METYCIGDRFAREYQNTISEYILSQVQEGIVALIGLESGNRWDDPVKVQTVMKITHEEFYEISGHKPFKKISSCFDLGAEAS